MDLKIRHGKVKIVRTNLKPIRKRLGSLKDYSVEYNRYDENGRIVYSKFLLTGFECFWDYDENGKCTHFKSNSVEKWYEFDNAGNLIHIKDNNDHEVFWEYDENGRCIYYKDTLNGREWRKDTN